MKTLGTRRGKKEQPKFATLQKPKSSRTNYAKMNPDELAYATINIKTSPRPRHANLKIGSASPIDVFPYTTPPSAGGYNEPPRYINLRTFREGNAMTPPAVAQHGPVDPPAPAEYRSPPRPSAQQPPKAGRRSSKDSVQPKPAPNCIGHEGQPSDVSSPKDDLKLNGDHSPSKPVGIAEPIKALKRTGSDAGPRKVVEGLGENEEVSWS